MCEECEEKKKQEIPVHNVHALPHKESWSRREIEIWIIFGLIALAYLVLLDVVF